MWRREEGEAWAPRRHKRFEGKRNKVAGGQRLIKGVWLNFSFFAYEIVAGLVLMVMGVCRKQEL